MTSKIVRAYGVFLLLSVCLILFGGLSSAQAQLQLPARQVSVTTNSFTILKPVSNHVQSVLEWLDDNQFTWDPTESYVMRSLTAGTGDFYRVNTSELLAVRGTVYALTSITHRVTTLTGDTGTFTGLSVTDLAATNLDATAITLGGSTWTNWPTHVSELLSSNVLINVTTNMTSMEIQRAIEAVPRDLNGHRLDIAFAAGDYAITNTIAIMNFQGGQVRMYGPGSSASIGTNTQTAILTSYGTNAATARVDGDIGTNWRPTIGVFNSSYVSISRLAIKFLGVPVTTTNFSAVTFSSCPYGLFTDNYVWSYNGSDRGECIYITGCGAIVVQYTQFRGARYAVISNFGSNVSARWNTWIGVIPTIGYEASYGGRIGISGGVTIGTTAAVAEAGGLIVNDTGSILP